MDSQTFTLLRATCTCWEGSFSNISGRKCSNLMWRPNLWGMHAHNQWFIEGVGGPCDFQPQTSSFPTKVKFTIICDRIWEKASFCVVAEFLFLIAQAVLATALKPGMVILQSLLYSCWKFHAPPTSDMGMAIASIACGRKSAVFMPHLGAPPIQVRT